MLPRVTFFVAIKTQSHTIECFWNAFGCASWYAVVAVVVSLLDMEGQSCDSFYTRIPGEYSTSFLL